MGAEASGPPWSRAAGDRHGGRCRWDAIGNPGGGLGAHNRGNPQGVQFGGGGGVRWEDDITVDPAVRGGQPVTRARGCQSTWCSPSRQFPT